MDYQFSCTLPSCTRIVALWLGLLTAGSVVASDVVPSTSGTATSMAIAPAVAGQGTDVPPYIKAVTYFGDAWPINFWNSDLSGVAKDMQGIRDDGFNGVIFVVPWGEFQPGLDPVRYDDAMFDRLAGVCRAASDAKLKVYLRVSYLWDFAPDDQLPNVARANEILTNDRLQPVWRGYLTRIRRATEGCAEGYFISWEDYWHVLDMPRSVKNSVDAVKVSKDIGFDDWVATHGSAEFRKQHEADHKTLGAYPVPAPTSPEFKEVYAWFDYQLSHRLLASAASILPNVSIEARVDSDPIYDGSSLEAWYPHDATYGVSSSPYLMTYWAPAMGAQNKGEVDSAEKATDRFVYMQKQILSKTQNHIFIEQLLYTDNTPKMSHNAQIDPAQMGKFLDNLSGPLLQFTSGYALWGYQNYRASMLYNGAFALGQKGWDLSGGAALVGTSVNLVPGAALRQAVAGSRDHYGAVSDDVTVRFQSEGAGVVDVSMGDVRVRATSDAGVGNQVITLKGAKSDADFVVRGVSGAVKIGHVQVYRFVQESSARDEDGHDLPDMAHIRRLNRNLDDLVGLPAAYSVQAGNMDRVVGAHGVEQDGDHSFAWAGPSVIAYLRPKSTTVMVKGALNVSMFKGRHSCAINGLVNGLDVGSIEYKEDGRFVLPLPVSADLVGKPVKISLASTCSTEPKKHWGDQRVLSFILDSIGVP